MLRNNRDISKRRQTIAASHPETTVHERERARPAVAQEALAKGVQSILEQDLEDAVPAEEWEELRTLLESLPLSTGNFALAINRLNNAKNYLQAGELGAAQFELRMLLAGLMPVHLLRV